MSNIIFEGKTPNGTPYIIRYTKKEDLQGMWRYINNLSKEKTYISLQGEEMSLEEERKFLDKSIEEKLTECIVLVVESNNEIVGISDVSMRTRAEKHTGVFGISLSKEYRSQGIGKILMECVLKEAKKIERLKIVRLACFAENTGAIRLYESFGFKEYGRLPNGLLYHEKPQDEVLMYKEINP